MSSFIKKVLGAIVGALLLFLGIERRKNKKQKEKLDEAKKRIAAADKYIKIQQATANVKDEILETQKENRVNKEEYEQKIKEAEATEIFDDKSAKQEEIINSITDFFNSRNFTL